MIFFHKRYTDIIILMIPNGLQNNPYMNQGPNQTILENQRRSRMHSQQQNVHSHQIGKPISSTHYATTYEDMGSQWQAQKLYRQNSQLELRLSQLSNQNRLLLEDNQNLKRQVNRYADALEKMYELHNQQQLIIQKLKGHEYQTSEYTESLNQRNLQLNNQIQNLAMDRQLLAYRLNEQDLRNLKEMQSISMRLNEKNNEVFELRKKVNALMEIKTKQEEDIHGLAFTLDNFRQKAELDMREKAIKLEGAQRSYLDAITAKNQEIRHLNDRLRSVQEQARKLRENNTLLLTRNQPTRIDHQNKLDNISRIVPESGIKSNFKSGGKDQKENQNAMNLKAQQLLEEKQKKIDEKQLQIMELNNKLKKYQEKMNSMQLQKINANRQQPKGIFQKQDQSKIVGSMVITIETLRNGLNKLVFQRFVTSVDHADKRKQNSLVLFITNMNEFIQKEGHQIKHSVEAYYEARNGIKDYLKKPELTPQMKQKLIVAIGKLVKYDNDFRDKVNKWIEGTLVFAIEQKRLDKSEKNKEILFLFRLLTIKYRIAYPISGKSYSVDQDLKAVLEHKIISSVRDFLMLRALQ